MIDTHLSRAVVTLLQSCGMFALVVVCRLLRVMSRTLTQLPSFQISRPLELAPMMPRVDCLTFALIKSFLFTGTIFNNSENV